LQTYPIYKNLAWLNELPPSEAESVFLDCCGSREWASQMAGARPFPMVEQMFEAAENIWEALPPADWLEAFAGHPKIGSKKPAGRKRRASEWSAEEQSGVDVSDPNVRKQFAEMNRLYHEKFGFIFIVCASGKSADEMLAIVKARIRNSVETELRLAAEEQKKITEIRLAKVLEQ
jgi:OHCU decarboxylase